MRPLRDVLRESAQVFGALPLSSLCNVSCLFCSNHQNPRGVETYSIPPRPLEDVLADLPLLKSKDRILIGESATRVNEGEPFLYEHIERVLLAVRKNTPGAVISVTTNGILLRDNHLHVLRDIGSVELTVSLNAFGDEMRHRLMADPSPGSAVAAIEAISRAGVPFHGSMVAVPEVTGWEDFRSALRFLASSGALTARVFIPGHTHIGRPLISDSALQQLPDEILSIQQESGLPISLEPRPLTGILPLVTGVVRHSPAVRAGFLTGDVISSVNGVRVETSCDAFFRIRDSASPEVSFTHGDQAHECRLLKPSGSASGLVMRLDLERRRLQSVLALCRSQHAGQTMIASSQLAYPMWCHILEANALTSRACVLNVPNRFFGGNIGSAGLLTVQDFVHAVRDWQAKNRVSQEISTLLIPREPFDPAGRDLVGQHWEEISAGLGRGQLKVVTL